MNISRMAGDIWEDFSDRFIRHGNKAQGAAMETANAAASGNDIDLTQHAIDLGRATAATLHPGVGFVDDIVTLGENTRDAIGSKSLQERSGNILQGAHSALAAVTGIGKAAAAGPLTPIVGSALAIGVPAAERMTDDKIRKEDTDEYRKHMDWFRHKENGTRNTVR